MNEGSNSRSLFHLGCDNCGSSDANTMYSDGHTYCFSCQRYVPGDGQPDRKTNAVTEPSGDFLSGRYTYLKARSISEKTCQRFRYAVGTDRRGEPVHIANYLDRGGKLIAQHIRGKDKTFYWIGDCKAAGLFGQHLWGDGGKRLFITEGEIDAMTVAEAYPTWAVVSIPNGAQAAVKCLLPHLEWLEAFDEIVLCFDNDAPGKEAALAAAQIFSPGKCKIASLPLKDASDMWVAGRHDELRQQLMFNARVYRPDGIVRGDDSAIKDYVVKFVPRADAHYPWPELDKKLFGMRRGELVVHTAGTGIGKSTVCREIAYHLGVAQNEKVGIVALEENVKRVGLFMVSIAANQRLHLGESTLDAEEKEKLFRASIGNGNFFLYDHWGSLDSTNLLSKIRYLVKACDCHWIILDHLSIVVSGLEGDDERKNLDRLMTDLRSVVEETQCGMHVISHLSRKPDGKSHEEGAPISLRDLRGSHAIVQIADMVLGYERNQQDEKRPNLVRVRNLKDRYSGHTGVVGELEYVDATGRTIEPGGFSIEQSNAPESPGF